MKRGRECILLTAHVDGYPLIQIYSNPPGSGNGVGAGSSQRGSRGEGIGLPGLPSPPAALPLKGPFALNHLAGVYRCFFTRLMRGSPELGAFPPGWEVQRLGHDPSTKPCTPNRKGPQLKQGLQRHVALLSVLKMDSACRAQVRW